MVKKEMIELRPNDLLAIIVIVLGGIGFILWGLGIFSFGNTTLQWLGGSIVALIGFVLTFLSRWLK